jgi:hypothetical protein
MAFWIVVMLAAAVPSPPDLEKDGVRLHAALGSSLYEWEVTNLRSEPIVRFEIGQHHAYDFAAPEGWEVASPMPDGVFQAWAIDEHGGIERGQTGRFSLRASSKGSVLGAVDAKVFFTSGDSVTLPEVWGPVPESRGAIYLVGGALALIVVVHTLLLARRNRSGRSRDSTGP